MTIPHLTRANLPQELRTHYIIVEDLSHYSTELQHHLSPSYARIITPTHHAKHPRINQTLHRPGKNIAELWGRLAHEPAQHSLLLIAQSRQLALQALASKELRTRLAECGIKLSQKSHHHQSCPTCCIFTCYPRNAEHIAEHSAQPAKLSTPTAHIFTEKDTRKLFNKAYHTTHPNTHAHPTQAQNTPHPQNSPAMHRLTRFLLAILAPPLIGLLKLTLCTLILLTPILLIETILIHILNS